MSKNILILFVVLFSVASCRKEVAKKFYVLQLNFSSGETIKIRGRIFEKNKKYKSDSESSLDNFVNMEENPDAIIFGDKDPIARFLFKTKEDKLVGSWLESCSFTNASFANNQEIIASGSLSLEGDYKSPYRKFTVENGTFTYKWANAEDYDMNDTILTGSWTLMRE